MSAAVRVRAVDRDDLAALEPIDARYAGRHHVEPFVTPASLGFYARSGHSFVAEDAGGVRGFVLAQSVWTGARPVLRVARLAAAADPASAAGPGTGAADVTVKALVEAVTKSAYDAAVYDLEAVVPKGDGIARAALEAADYVPRPARVYARTLGSRGRG